MPVISVQFNQLWGIASDARKRASDAFQANPKVLTPDATIAIVFAAVSTEAFINELAAVLKMRKDRGDYDKFLSIELKDFADTLTDAEKNRVSLSKKYLLASEKLGSRFKEDEQPFADFDLLVKLRNDHVHVHPWYESWLRNPGEPPPKDAPQHIKQLLKSNLARQLRPGTGMAWLNRLQTPEMASWACNASRAIILAILALIPDDDPVHDPTYELFKFPFR